jgi:hypothetical protein
MRDGGCQMRIWNSLLLSLVILFSLSACQEESKPEAEGPIDEITVTAGAQALQPLVQSRTAEAVDYNDTGLFQAITQDAASLPYVKLGEDVEIRFQGKAPDSYELTDSVLKQDGTEKYWKPSPDIISLSHKNNTASFQLKENTMAFMSSQSKDYEPGATIRGFRLVCRWEDQIQEYAFVLRTDANKSQTH